MDDWKAWIREIAYERIDQIERHLNSSPEVFPEFAEAANKIDAAMDEIDEHPDAKLTERDDLWMTYSAALALEMYLAGTRDGGRYTMHSLPVSCRRFRSVRRSSMNRLTHEELADLRRRYPKGSRVKLICMNDPYCRNLKPGMTGTVMRVDDIGTIHVAWDCGSTLGVMYGEDSCTVVDMEGEKRMTDRTRKTLGDLKARQDAGERMPCPRCGRDTMKENVYSNALSRHADIYICDACGTEEALLKFMHNPLPLREWACFLLTQKPSDFKMLPAEEVWKRVQDTQVSFLMKLYERWLDEHEYEDFNDYRAAAFESCPGLTALWAQPFRAEYAAADGNLVLRFRLIDEGIEVAADITK